MLYSAIRLYYGLLILPARHTASLNICTQLGHYELPMSFGKKNAFENVLHQKLFLSPCPILLIKF